MHRGRSLHGAWDATDLMVPEPRGVAVVLTPWNDPVAVAAGLIGAALVTGNTVVHKPSERCPRPGAASPRSSPTRCRPGVLEIVDGDGAVGARAGRGTRSTWSRTSGARPPAGAIAEAGARTGAQVLLENGGNDPLVVDADVDPEWAAAQAALGAFANAGQICVAVERIYVHAHRGRPVPGRAGAGRRCSGPSGIGPLVDREHRAGVHAQVGEAVAAGARALTGGAVPDGPGAFYPATVLTDCDRRRCAVLREETFGPVAPVRVVPDFGDGPAARRPTTATAWPPPC